MPPPSSRPSITEELLGLTPLELAEFSATKAANASQSAAESANALAEYQHQLLIFAADVGEAKRNARDSKMIGLALAEHFNLNLAAIDVTPRVGSKIVPIRPSPHPFRK